MWRQHDRALAAKARRACDVMLFSVIHHRKMGAGGCNAARVLVTLLPNHMRLFAGLPNRVLVWRITSNSKEDARAEEGKKNVEEKSQKEEVVNTSARTGEDCLSGLMLSMLRFW